MKKYEKIYNELRKEMNDEEIAESMLIPADMTPEEREKSDEELRAFRMKLLRERTEEQRIVSDLMRLKFQIEDYIKSEDYSSERSFGKVLEEYLLILRRTKKSLSEDLNIHYSRLSRIINDKEDPSRNLIFRLEEHSGKIISALLWWKLVNKKHEYQINSDIENRAKEKLNVKNAIRA